MIRDLLKNKKIVLTISIFILISIIVIVWAILNSINSSKNNTTSSPKTEKDKATGQTITTFSGYKANDIMYIGFDILLDSGVTSNQIQDLKNQIKEYGKTVISNLERISYYKNSYTRISKSSPVTHSLKFALNNDKKDIYVKIISKGVDNYEIHLYDDEAMINEVKKYSFCSALACPPKNNPDDHRHSN